MSEGESKANEALPLQPEFYDLVRIAFEDTLAIAQKLSEQKTDLFKHNKFPQALHWENSKDCIVRIMSSLDSRLPVDYVFALQVELRTRSRQPDNSIVLPAWENLLAYAIDNDYIGNYFRISDCFAESDPDRWTNSFRQTREKLIIEPVLRMVDHYIHVSGFDYNLNVFNELYRQWERSVFADKLDLSIEVPILRVGFDFDRLPLSEDACIVRMTDNFQISRCLDDHDAFIPSEDVARLSTHAFSFGLTSTENKCYEQREGTLESLAAYSDIRPIIDDFFAALKAVTGSSFGYAQIIAKPYGWARSWQATVPRTYLIRVRDYPEYLEDWEWRHKEPPPRLPEEACRKIGPVFKAIREQSKLRIAARRLNAVMLRKDEADSILDVTIGLETLLGGDGPGEVTYKLRTRLAALCLVIPYPGHTPWEVRDLCNKVYDFRSKVVHGSSGAKGKRVISTKGGVNTPTVDIGIELLKYAISVMSKHPQYLNPNTLDMFLLTRGINSNNDPGC